MFLEILLGAVSGYLLRQLYYDYVFAPFPEVRVTGVSALLPFAGALTLAFAVDVVYRVVKTPWRGWAKGPFWNRSLGLSLFAGAFLQIEASKVATEYLLDPIATACVTGFVTFALSWTWVRHLRYKSLLTSLPDDAPSMLLAEAAKTINGSKASKKQKPAERPTQPVISATATTPKQPKRKVEKRASSVDDVWAAFDKEIRSRSRTQIAAQREAARATT